MYFKRLELVGFKSFANKTKLKFEPGVTAVVGPNGCGKSNIADAIKWVLGEQSAKELRGSRMEDVIFNGTSNKEPINMAEVSLVFSNKDKVLPIDYEEVTITRRLFRSGESEYLINKMPVRLKDINELLAGTGMGTSSYSIIEQGQIGQILSSKAEERREIFEEASGITKFKLKKKEALRKLEHTETNLVRLNDIVGEVERQIKSIERQAKKAEKYKESFDVLKDMELKYSKFKYNTINNELKALSVESDDFKKREEDLAKGIELLREDFRASKENLKKLSSERQNAEMELAHAKASMDKNTHTARINSERIKELKGYVEKLNKETAFSEEKLKNKKENLEEYEEKLHSQLSEKENKESLLKEKEELLKSVIADISSTGISIKENKEKIVDLLSIQTRAKNELIKLDADMQNRKSRLRRLKIEAENISKEKDSLQLKIQDIANRFNAAADALSAEKNNVDSAKNEITDLDTALINRREAIFNHRQNKESLKSRMEILEELVEKREGFDKSVKVIAEECGSQVKIIADLISVEPAFLKAAESALGELAQAVVVGNLQEVFPLIDFVQNKKSGKANFIIHEDIVKLRLRAPKNLTREAVPLIDRAKCEDAYRDILLYLFADTYLVNTREEADRLFERFRNCTFVTKDGYLRKGPRVMAGAIIEGDTSIVGRKEKIKTIGEEIASLDKSIGEESEMLKNEEFRLEERKKSLTQKENALREKESALSTINAVKTGLLNDFTKISEESEIINMEMEDVASGLEAFNKKGQELNLDLNEKENDLNISQKMIEDNERKIKDSMAIKEETLLKISDLKGEIANIRISCDNISANLNMRKSECLDIEDDIKAKENEKKESAEKIAQLSEEIARVEEEKGMLEEKVGALKLGISRLSDKIDIETTETDKKENILQKKDEENELLKNNMRDIEIKLTEINYKKNSLQERMENAYKIELSELSVEIDENTNWDEIKESVDGLKQKLDKMGAVNLVAIEEHKELEERFQFLKRQKDDLESAKDSLHKAIIKINATTKKLFLETFQKVQAEFKNYFRMLFGGGHAEVFLLDEKDVLESGIEIVVRPPGKKLQSIMLLSGGEKALTAISLLFAIFKINPSPFCILDEIDAPLDETNIDRFTRVLHDFVKMSQFILITHSKKTMQMADILYGITMAEKGISRIVSVKFADDEKEADREEVMV